MKVEELRIGQMVHWSGGGMDIVIPPARVIGLREKFSRSPDLRLVSVHLWFDTPLFPDSIVDPTERLWVDSPQVTLLKAEPWFGRDEAELRASQGESDD